ncbi:MAG: ABC transporter permease [Pseudonocardiaceae bacterium]|nr:MAG: ABC transporter permease [Pseudonocardiaceae bacterium]
MVSMQPVAKADGPAKSAGPDAGPEARRKSVRYRRTRTRLVDRLTTLAIVVGLLAAAEISARAGWVSDQILPAPSSVATTLFDGIFGSGIFVRHGLATLLAIALGFTLAVALAFAVAAVLAISPRAERALMPILVGLQSLPKIAIAPLVLIWLGFGLSSKVLIVIFAVFFPVLVNTLTGLRIRDRELWTLMRSLGASKRQVFVYLRLPGAVPYLFAGLQVGILLALLGTVVAEFVGSDEGLGYVLLLQKGQLNVPGVYASLVVLMSIGITLKALMSALEKRFAFWQEENVVAGI